MAKKLPDPSSWFNEPYFEGNTRVCRKCGARGFRDCEVRDPCMVRDIPNCHDACCGHGIVSMAYVIFDDKQELWGLNALNYLANL